MKNCIKSIILALTTLFAFGCGKGNEVTTPLCFVDGVQQSAYEIKATAQAARASIKVQAIANQGTYLQKDWSPANRTMNLEAVTTVCGNTMDAEVTLLSEPVDAEGNTITVTPMQVELYKDKVLVDSGVINNIGILMTLSN